MKLLVWAIALIAIAGTCSAFDISQIRNFDAGNFSGYPGIAGIRQNVMLSYYSQGKDNQVPGFQEFAAASLDFMQRFKEAQASSLSENPETLQNLSTAAGLASASLDNLESTAKDSIPLSKFSAYLARSAFEDYASAEAERLKGAGDAEPQTKKKLAYYGAASSLYSYSGENVKASEVRAQHSELQSSYVSEMQRADSLSEGSWSQCSVAMRGEMEWFGLPSYASLRQCISGLVEAREIYVANLEEERIKAVDMRLYEAEGAQASLSQAVWEFFASLVVIFLALNALVVSRVRTWSDDSYDSSLGSEVLRWKNG